jgi:HSP90 family molecular chaperone
VSYDFFSAHILISVFVESTFIDFLTVDQKKKKKKKKKMSSLLFSILILSFAIAISFINCLQHIIPPNAQTLLEQINLLSPEHFSSTSVEELALREILSLSCFALETFRLDQAINNKKENVALQLQIKISQDSDKTVLRIFNNGHGTTQRELEENFLHSIENIDGTGAYLNIVRDETSLQQKAKLIEQLDIGFYSAFLIASKVTIVSRIRNSYSDVASMIITENGNVSTSSFSFSSSSSLNQEGTEFLLELRNSTSNVTFIREVIQSLVSKYSSNCVNFPVYYYFSEDENESVHQLNSATEKFFWRKNPDSQVIDDTEYYRFYAREMSNETVPIARFHKFFEGEVEFYALLFIPLEQLFPKQENSSLRFYIRRVLVNEHFEGLLPNYLNFVQGVVDSDDFPLSSPRMSIAESRITKIIRMKLTRFILQELQKLAESGAFEFAQVMSAHGDQIRKGLQQEGRTRNLEILKSLISRDEHHEDL